MKMKMFGIRNAGTKAPMGYSIFSNEGGEFCNSVGCRLEMTDDNDPIWLVNSRSEANLTLNDNSEWYNASREHPCWPMMFNPVHFEIFECELTIF